MGIIKIGEDTAISWIDTLRAWRSLTGKNNFRDIETSMDEYDQCPDCNSTRAMDEKTFGPIHCICKTKWHEEHLLETVKQYESVYQRRTKKSWVFHGTTTEKTAQANMLRDVNEWLTKLNSWLVLYGTVGTGKSFIMEIINSNLTPWSIYVPAPDLEQAIFYAGKYEDGLEILISRLSHHPILLLDDFGADYGSGFPISILRKIIDYRYRLPKEYLTVVSTNRLGVQDAQSHDMRIGDRIFDVNNSKLIKFDWQNARKTEGVVPGAGS